MSERMERAALAFIVIVVGVLAGRASFSHVVQWSMDNLPDGTPRSYGYTNATVSELLPISVLLFMRCVHQYHPGDFIGIGVSIQAAIQAAHRVPHQDIGARNFRRLE